MKRSTLLALVGLAAGAATLTPASAQHSYESRREIRREAIVAGAVRHEIASDRAEQRYRECMRGSRYDQDCDRQRWEDEQEARRKGRRTAVLVGVAH